MVYRIIALGIAGVNAAAMLYQGNWVKEYVTNR
jgi:hypothetical protein